MSKHTPGPWIYGAEVGADSTRIETESGKIIGAIRTRSITGWQNNVHPVYSWDYEGAANARLIAAAPDLLDFAEEFVEAWENGMAGDSFLLRIANSAIAKATGSQP